MLDDSRGSSSLLDISKPSNRKCCKICKKFVYYHQRVFLCGVCKDVFHGTCLKLNNVKVFILQQISWKCIFCCFNGIDESIFQLSCQTCWCNVDVYNENFVQCKQCNAVVHASCIVSKLCMSCLPVKISNDIRTANKAIDADITYSNKLAAFFPKKLNILYGFSIKLRLKIF